MTFLPSVLTGLLTVMSMFAANASRIGWEQLPVSLAFAVLVGLFFAFIFWLNPLTTKSMSVVSSVFTACFFLWYAITPYAGLALVVLAVVLGIRFRVQLSKVTKPLTIILTCALAVSVGQTLITTNWSKSSAKDSGIVAIHPITSEGEVLWQYYPYILPNIYFIIPDRFPSIDALTESGIDSTEFVSNLRSMGFYVKENQMSQDAYTQTSEGKVTATRTMRYLASVLNDGQEITLQTPYRQIFSMIRNPAIISELHVLGYQYDHIGSWFTETSYSPNADVNYVYQGRTLWEKLFKHEFTTAVWNRTVLKGVDFGWFWKGSIGDISISRLGYQMQSIDKTSQLQNQHFVFAHLIMPHEPYILNSEGWSQRETNLTETELYYEQIKGTMQILSGIVERINYYDPDAIILIQSDEGMAFSDSQELTKALSDTQWNGVLTAWRIPGADESELEQLKHTEILGWLIEYLESK